MSTPDPSNKPRQTVRNEKGQIPKGYSGNYKGRPRKELPPISSQQVRRDFLMAAEQLMTIAEGGKKKTVPIMQVIFKQLLTKAAQGDRPCIIEATKFYCRIMDEHDTAKGSAIESVIKMTDAYIENPESFTDEQIRALKTMRKAAWDPRVVF